MRLMFFSDSPLIPSGMGRSALNLGRHFSRLGGVDFASIGWHHGRFDQGSDPWKIYGVHKTGPGQSVDAEKRQVREAVEDFKPDFLITLGDIWDFEYMVELSDMYSLQWIPYWNIDARPIKLSMVPKVVAASQIMTTSMFGANALRDMDPSLDVRAVYHGYDPKIFVPLEIPEDGRVLREPNTPKVIKKLSGHFVVLMDAQNTHRKNYPAALEAWGKFSKDKSNVHLIIVANPEERDTGFDLEYVIHFTERIRPDSINIFKNDLQCGAWYTDEFMNYLYNISDVYLCTSRAEGFGLSMLQAYATKTIPVVTDYGSYPELVGQGGGLTINVGATELDYNYRKVAAIDPDHAAEQLETIYNDWCCNKEMVREFHGRGLAFASNNTWTHSFTNVMNVVGGVMERGPKAKMYPMNPSVRVYNDLRVMVANESRRCPEVKEHIGMVVMGGLGDNIQAIPVIRGIARKHPDSSLFVICEANSGIFFDPHGQPVFHPKMSAAELRGSSFASVLKTCCSIFDYFYDVRYVSRVYNKLCWLAPLPVESDVFYGNASQFYTNWPWANNVIHHLNKHVVDIRLLSTGLHGLASMEDMKLDPEKFPLPDGPFVSIHNGAGGVGQLKLMPSTEMAAVVKYLNDRDFMVVQTGVPGEELIPGAVDLRGKTSYWQTAYLLKRAAIHVGPEGALYHMSKAVGGRRGVWLSVTPKQTFCYDDDEFVLPSSFKCEPCWWKGHDYFHNKCMLGYEHCMNLPSGRDIINELERVL